MVLDFVYFLELVKMYRNKLSLFCLKIASDFVLIFLTVFKKTFSDDILPFFGPYFECNFLSHLLRIIVFNILFKSG